MSTTMEGENRVYLLGRPKDGGEFRELHDLVQFSFFLVCFSCVSCAFLGEQELFGNKTPNVFFFFISSHYACLGVSL